MKTFAELIVEKRVPSKKRKILKKKGKSSKGKKGKTFGPKAKSKLAQIVAKNMKKFKGKK